MGSRHPQYPGSMRSWNLVYYVVPVLITAATGGVILISHFGPLFVSWGNLMHNLDPPSGGDPPFGATTHRAYALRRTRRTQEQRVSEPMSEDSGGTAGYWPCAGGDSAVNAIGTQLSNLVDPGPTRGWLTVYMDVVAESGRNPDKGLLKTYTSFAMYALKSSRSADPLPLPLVTIPIGHVGHVGHIGHKSPLLLSIPLITIIGVQKGGTTSLRGNLMTHPLVSGMPNEVHFFDRGLTSYPRLGKWPGDGGEKELGPGIVGRILAEYAKACMEYGKPKNKNTPIPVLSSGVIVESSPRYILSPIAPYRMKMVLPGARLVVVLRDPTDRYFSHLRMVMCKGKPDPRFASLEEMVNTYFHSPGGAKEYLARAEASYQPYAPLCRGENATSEDLMACFKRMTLHNPLHRGLYADQLERWFRVFDRSQILVVDSAEMFKDFTGTVARVAAFGGLPDHKFEYDPRHEFRGACTSLRRSFESGSFSKGGKYEAMLEDEELFRDWYRPHNDRLFKLLGRELMWQ